MKKKTVYKPIESPPLNHEKLPLAKHEFIKNKQLDVAYAFNSNSQKMDIYMPNEPGMYPCIFFIHGGAFAMCDKSDRQVQPFLEGVKKGFVVVSVNYRLSGESIFPAGLQDCKSAIRFLRANAKKYQIDSDKIAACGGSAGGNFVEMLCTSAGINLFDDISTGNQMYSSEVQAGVAWFAPTDFLLMDKQLKENHLFPQDHSEELSPESRYLGGKITELDYNYVQKSNPMTYVHSNIPPMLIQHGRMDHLVPYQQSVIFVDKIRRIAGDDKVIFEILETADHGDKLFETKENMEKVFCFLEESLR
ncbi:alpha/beta hydrolase [Mariniplasma anaerobium]|uniref:Alpha/beta hydrolase n=1 Tax=Mariniplasma anaerobium TaxID=2735436 RepID=A0A7U9THQ2_9MOLU|nr:alpha/beta hydrolase [Mariniplasma anaerobium]BCR36718.1 alpha/beta hydrolase [Mariniplasma anaerobium]